MQQSVVVQHIEGDSWALVITATRSESGRRSIVPTIFANEGCGIFAAAPQLKSWVRGGFVVLYNPPPDRREELLKNAVSEFVRQVSLRSFIKERSSVGIIARHRSNQVEFLTPPEGFELSRASEPAFFYLCEKSETGYQAMRVARYLIAKNNIGALTQHEREEQQTKLLLRGEGFQQLRSYLKGR